MFFGVTGLAIRKYFRGINSNAPRLETLPIDILIYGIFCYIDIREIFQLRRVSVPSIGALRFSKQREDLQILLRAYYGA